MLEHCSQILWRGQEKIMGDVPSRDDRENGTAGAKVENRF